MEQVHVKICGLTTVAQVTTALDVGANYIGFMTFPKSPRHLSTEDAGALAALTIGRAKSVSVLVNPSEDLIARVLEDIKPDYVQLHGSETPQFCASLQARGVGVIKAFGVSGADDLDLVSPYLGAIDMVLFDARPPKDALRPGGLGQVFDWTVLKDLDLPVPWFVSGGLNASNVRQACKVSGAKMVDVSSGVESAAGLKDDALMRAFMAAVKTDA